jgi:hypothetical protein
MSNFLSLIQEATPESVDQASTDEAIAPKGSATVKKGGFLNKVVSATQKATNLAKKIGDVGQGKWDINDALQKVLDKQLDKSIDKVGYFGKSGYNRIRLEGDVAAKINTYGQDTSGNTAESPEASEANESTLPGYFIKRINEAQVSLDRDKTGGFKNIEQMAGNEGGKSKNQRVWDVLKDVLGLDTEMKLTDPDTGKKVVDRRIVWISKGVPTFLKAVKQYYSDIPFTFKAHDSKEGLSGASVEDAEEQEFNFEESTRDDWIKSLGEEKAEKIVRGIKDIYPGDKIEFEEPDPAGEPEGPAGGLDSFAGNIFELAGRTSFGEKGIQWTLKPLQPAIADMLKSKDIKYLTYLLQTPDNEFKSPEKTSGIVYAYGNENQLINDITTEGVNFQWNGQEKLYTLSTSNEAKAGINYSKGEFPIGKTDVMPLTDMKHVLWRPEEDKAYKKFKILKDLKTSGKYVISYKDSVDATEADIKEAEANNNPSPTSETTPQSAN